MSGSRNLNFPLFSGQWCDASGNLTPLAQAAVRCLWSRTGNAPGIDAVGLATDIAEVSLIASQALQSAQEALAEALALMMEAQRVRAEAVNGIREAQEEARVALLEGRAIRAQAQRALEDAGSAVAALLELNALRAELRSSLSSMQASQEGTGDIAVMAIMNSAHGSDFF